MAEFNDIEDLRDWFIDMCGEMLSKIDDLNGDEPFETMTLIQQSADKMHNAGLEVIQLLDKLLVNKKREDS